MGVVKLEELRAYKDYKRVCDETGSTGGDSFLPDSRNREKDIAEYMCVINSKIDFVKDTMDRNPYNSSHFAWIDFSITYVFKNVASCQRLLQFYNAVELEEKFLCVTGCLGKTPIEDINGYINRVNWRFCGGFFIGDKASMQEFYELNTTYFYDFLSKYKKLVWEVNFWAWLEVINPNWTPRWTKADHNDTVIDIPAIFFATSLKNAVTNTTTTNTTTNTETNDPPVEGDACNNTAERYKIIKYDYPHLEGFYPSSASHYSVKVGDTRKHYLNTRYVNYRIIHDGWYQFSDPNKKIISRNMFCMLDEKTLLPTFFCEVDEKEMGIVSKQHSWSVGVEDIRLFANKRITGANSVGDDRIFRNGMTENAMKENTTQPTGDTPCSATKENECLSEDKDGVIPDTAERNIATLDFIATTINYSNRDHNRMILGKYVIDEDEKRVSLKNCGVLASPAENPEVKNIVCEKNWIPIGNEQYLYKWSPFEIIQYRKDAAEGEDNKNDEGGSGSETGATGVKHNGVVVAVTSPSVSPICRKFRGSTVFVEGGDENELLGIVHFTEGDGYDKCYFHSLVAIDKETMKPKRYTQPFYFEKKGIEYCIGFYIENNKYHYWISQMDREPLLIVSDPPNLVWLPF
jgi:hypothetical protein